jgi:hypothetical protein
LAVALPVLLYSRGEQPTTSSTNVAAGTTITASPPSTQIPTSQALTTQPPTSLVTTAPGSATTTTTPPLPGDSAGRWTPTRVADQLQQGWGASVSDKALVVQIQDRMTAYLFDEARTVHQPIKADSVSQMDSDGRLLVWSEHNYNGGNEVTDGHIYACLLPDGPKLEIAAGSNVGGPQVAGSWVTWIETKPWALNPEEYVDVSILGVRVDKQGHLSGPPLVLVPSAVATTLGDTVWTYSLSPTHLAWEQHTSAGPFEAGSYVMDLTTLRPHLIDREAYQPSVAAEHVAFVRSGVEIMNIRTEERKQIDPQGMFPAVAPTFVAYFRPVDTGDVSDWEVVAKGLTGTHEQVLIERTGTPPWFLQAISVSSSRIALVVDDSVYAFEWQSD